MTNRRNGPTGPTGSDPFDALKKMLGDIPGLNDLGPAPTASTPDTPNIEAMMDGFMPALQIIAGIHKRLVDLGMRNADAIVMAINLFWSFTEMAEKKKQQGDDPLGKLRP